MGGDPPKPVIATAGSLQRDQHRLDRVSTALEKAALDALVCALPSNVLMLSGYWPTIGNAVAIATADGRVGLVAPEDEYDDARESWADPILTFSPASLNRIVSPLQAVAKPLRDVAASLRLTDRARVGFEGSGSFNPSGYAAVFEYGAGMRDVLLAALPNPALVDAGEILAGLRSTLTPREIAMVRRACDIAQAAFASVVPRLKPGVSEVEVAAALRSALAAGGRSDGFGYCMSGPNAARAYAAYQRSSSRPLQTGDCVLLHCNSYCGGFWTDITRTFVIGEPSRKQHAIFDAIRQATEAAFGAVCPGAPAAAADQAARSVLSARGYSNEFRHATGHGVGFAAIDHDARPRIHPASTEMLAPGMVFNIEPAVYVSGEEGVRQCNMALVTEAGVERLTPFLNAIPELRVTEAPLTSQRKGSEG